MADKQKHENASVLSKVMAPDGEDPVERLLRVMAVLRGEAGCPWDRVQTHRSLLPFLIEEAYELIEAIEGTESTETGGEKSDAKNAGDTEETADTADGPPHPSQDAAIREELGDVLLQVVFHAQIAEERGAFSFRDVAGDLAAKLEARHPHVFGGEALPGPEAVREAWHRAKMETRDSAMEGVPAALPALQWAHQVSQRAAREGFEWNHKGEIHHKAAEEMAEFFEAISERDGGGSREAAEMEMGDLLFSLVQLARWEGIDPETALRRSTRKFIGRFQWMETALREQGRRPGQNNAEQWWALWDEAKNGTGTETE